MTTATLLANRPTELDVDAETLNDLGAAIIAKGGRITQGACIGNNLVHVLIEWPNDQTVRQLRFMGEKPDELEVAGAELLTTLAGLRDDGATVYRVDAISQSRWKLSIHRPR
jgi:hypothetical protein